MTMGWGVDSAGDLDRKIFHKSKCKHKSSSSYKYVSYLTFVWVLLHVIILILLIWNFWSHWRGGGEGIVMKTEKRCPRFFVYYAARKHLKRLFPCEIALRFNWIWHVEGKRTKHLFICLMNAQQYPLNTNWNPISLSIGCSHKLINYPCQIKRVEPAYWN